MTTNRSNPQRGAVGTWCVDYVDVVVLPHGVCGCRLDGDASLSLQLHGVHSCPHTILPPHLWRSRAAETLDSVHTWWTSPGMIAHLMDLCYPAGVVEDALGQGGLPRVDVG